MYGELLSSDVVGCEGVAAAREVDDVELDVLRIERVLKHQYNSKQVNTQAGHGFR